MKKLLVSIFVFSAIILAIVLSIKFSSTDMKFQAPDPQPLQFDDISVKFGASGTSGIGMSITPLELIEDNRCPKGVDCESPGSVKIKIHVSKNDTGQDYILELAQKMQTSYGDITLVEVQPVRVSANNLEHGQYIFRFSIQY